MRREEYNRLKHVWYNYYRSNTKEGISWFKDFNNWFEAVIRLPEYQEGKMLRRIDATKPHYLTNLCWVDNPKYKAKRYVPKAEDYSRTPEEYLTKHLEYYGNTYLNRKQYKALGKDSGVAELCKRYGWFVEIEEDKTGYIVRRLYDGDIC